MDEIRFISPFRFNSASPVLIDVGAHHGYVTLVFAKKGWRVVAFEPEEVNRTKFLSNVRGYDNVSCVPNAVSNVSGQRVPFFVSKQHYGIHSLRAWHSTHELAYDVEAVRLDDILPKHGIENVTFLKIDIEGADFLALQGFDIARYRPELVMMEFMDSRTELNFGYSHHDVVTFMKARGYSALVSEWSPVNEYAREGIETAPTTKWLRAAPYSPQGKPAWGNLFFVPEREFSRFRTAIAAGIRRERAHVGFVRFAKKLPRIYEVMQRIKSAMSRSA